MTCYRDRDSGVPRIRDFNERDPVAVGLLQMPRYCCAVEKE
jgi:hypothetical protein